MTKFNIVKAINYGVNNEFLGQERFYVVFADGPRVGTRENIVGYDTEAKAKRRIRDLEKRNVHSNLVTPIAPCENALIRQVGCYPYLKKSQYIR